MKIIGHITVVTVGLLLILILPGVYYASHAGLFSGNADAVSGATLAVPDQPSGDFYVFVNRERHAGSLEDWTNFFEEKPVGVIMEDVSCFSVKGDRSGQELARRYQARLAENQMKLTLEEGLLLVSRAENGLFDILILSKEAAEQYDYTAVIARSDTLTLQIHSAAA